MAKSTIEKNEEMKEKISQHENQKKKLMQEQKTQEGKARTKRLIERGAIVESLIDRAETLTNEEIKSVLTIALNSEPAIEKLIATQEKQVSALADEPQTAQGARAA